MKTTDKAYFAGLFDGEGYVHIALTVRQTNTASCKAGQTVTNAHLAISNNNPVPLLELEEKFGGTVRPHGGKPGHWRWVTTGFRAVRFAREILPYSRIKRSQLEIYVAFAALKRRRPKGAFRLTVDELAERRALVSDLHTERRKSSKPRLYA